MRKKIVTVGLSAILLLSGCAEDKLVEEMELSSNNTESQIMVADEAKDNVEIMLQDSAGKKMKLNCELDLNGYEDASYYELEIEEITDQSLKEIAQNFFDNGEYTVLAPYSVLSDEELETLGKEYEENGHASSHYGALNPRDFIGLEKATMEEGQVLVSSNVLSGAQESRIRGQLNGKLYELYYFNPKFYDAHFFAYPVELQHKYTECTVMNSPNIAGYSTKVAETFGENECDRDEIENDVNQLLARLPFSDFEISSVSHRCCLYDDNSIMKNMGYHYRLTRNVAGIATLSFDGEPIKNDIASYDMEGDGVEELEVGEELGIEPSYIPETNTNEYNIWTVFASGYGTEYIEVDMDDSGLVYMDMKAPMGIPVIKDGESKKLDIDQCIEGLEEKMSDWDIGAVFEAMKTDNELDMELTINYLPVEYEGYVLVYEPVLILHLPTKIDGTIQDESRAYIGINVIDGSMVEYSNVVMSMIMLNR